MVAAPCLVGPDVVKPHAPRLARRALSFSALVGVLGHVIDTLEQHRCALPVAVDVESADAARAGDRVDLIILSDTTDPDIWLAEERAWAALAESLPAALVPRLVLVDELPTRTSGKVDRDALPWPVPGSAATG